MKLTSCLIMEYLHAITKYKKYSWVINFYSSIIIQQSTVLQIMNLKRKLNKCSIIFL